MLSLITVSLFAFLLTFSLPISAETVSLEQQILIWEQSLQKSNTINTHLKLVQAYRRLGLSPQSQTHLDQALHLAQTQQHHDQHIRILLQQVENALENANLSQAVKTIEKAQKLSQTHDNLLAAEVLNMNGNVQRVQQQFDLARASYTQALALLQSQPTRLLSLAVLNNQIQLAIQQKYYRQAQQFYQQALAIEIENPSVAGYLKQRLQLAQLALLLPDLEDKKSLAYLLQHSLKQAQQADLPAFVSRAYGYLSQLYQTQPDASLQWIRQAIFIAQQHQYDDLLFLWYAQLGALLHQQGDDNSAIRYYRQAIAQLQLLRPIMSRYDQNFYLQVMPVYLALLDLLLQQAQTQPDKAQDYLRQARTILEQYKTVELENYFQDVCVTPPEKQKPQWQLPADVAVLHPVLLPNRTVLLLSIGANIQQIVLSGERKDLQRQLRQFLKYLDKKTGQRLYDWLIQPIAQTLETAQIKTLVVVPQGKLLTLPFAALHDGKQYLVEQYAVVTTPAFHLTDLQRLQNPTLSLLLGGLSEPSQAGNTDSPMRNFGALPHVTEELAQIYALYGGTAPLLNQDFNLHNINQALQTQSYTMIHFATHGEFNRSMAKSFVLTYDSQLAMGQLKDLLATVKDPLDLLTLSACETAVGDDEQAALGLAGLAVKSGAHSALASLWPVYDDATAILIPDFYAQLKQKNTNKAQALQQAQLTMLNNPRYQHPKYWAGFVLIGRWY